MTHKIEINLRIKLTLIVIIFLLLFTGIVYSGISDEDRKSEVIRFDTIIELNAPNAGTPILLFARYWVSKDFYSIGFNWAEPQVGNINFPTYPPGMTISSNEKEFITTSQAIESHNETYSKPIEDRGVFKNALGSYPFRNIRFAERDALELKIYKEDIASIPDKNNNQSQLIEITDTLNNQGIKRNVTKLEVTNNNGNIKSLRAFDANGLLLKDINYEYTTQDGKTLLKRESVLMPEKRILVGYDGKGVTITLNGQKKMYKELLGFHHTGARKCDIEYESINTNKGPLSVPSSIVVKRADVNYTLRTAKMSNFTQLKMSSEEAQKQALEYSKLSKSELEVRDLLDKYWLKNPDDINDIDTKRLAQLRDEFDNKKSEISNTPEKLKNIGMLLNLDWIQNDSDLHKDFDLYMKVLKENNFSQMILLGGVNAINMTSRWSRYADADKLLKKWIENVVPEFNAMEILNFSEIQIKEQQYWVVLNLFDKYLKSKKDIGAARFDIEVMRYMALLDFIKLIENPSTIKRESVRSQIDWALNSTKKEDLVELAKEGLANANKLFSELEEPNRIQLSLKNKLDQGIIKTDEENN